MTQSLVTVQEYRDVVKDTTTSASAVEEALDEAVDLLEGDGGLERLLRSMERTETVEIWYIDGQGYVYPLATPITAVPASASYVIDPGSCRLRGVVADALTAVGNWPVITTSVWGEEPQTPTYASVVYTGGFTHDTLPTPLKRAIARVAHALIFASPQRVAVAGAQSISVGDVSVSFPKFTGPLDELVPGISVTLRGFKRRRIRY